jgi:hypothetical protein
MKDFVRWNSSRSWKPNRPTSVTLSEMPTSKRCICTIMSRGIPSYTCDGSRIAWMKRDDRVRTSNAQNATFNPYKSVTLAYISSLPAIRPLAIFFLVSVQTGMCHSAFPFRIQFTYRFILLGLRVNFFSRSRRHDQKIAWMERYGCHRLPIRFACFSLHTLS